MNHKPDGRAIEEGGHKTIAIAEAPHVVDIGVRAANLIGDGFMAIDIKTGPNGPIVIEINDNPNLEHGIEDEADKQAWNHLTEWFVKLSLQIGQSARSFALRATPQPPGSVPAKWGPDRRAMALPRPLPIAPRSSARAENPPCLNPRSQDRAVASAPAPARGECQVFPAQRVESVRFPTDSGSYALPFL